MKKKNYQNTYIKTMLNKTIIKLCMPALILINNYCQKKKIEIVHDYAY